MHVWWIKVSNSWPLLQPLLLISSCTSFRYVSLYYVPRISPYLSYFLCYLKSAKRISWDFEGLRSIMYLFKNILLNSGQVFNCLAKLLLLRLNTFGSKGIVKGLVYLLHYIMKISQILLKYKIIGIPIIKRVNSKPKEDVHNDNYTYDFLNTDWALSFSYFKWMTPHSPKPKYL